MDSPKPQDSSACQFHQFHHHHRPPVSHHHHYFYPSPHCPLHKYTLHFRNQHSPACPLFASSNPPPQNPQTALSSIPSISKEPGFNPPGGMHKENEELEGEEYLQMEEEEEDPVFVLTDEWREFFAKSEAKRRLAKKQARKKGKNRME